MKRIIGFFTILILVLAIAETSLATPQEMMKKQTTEMTSKKPVMQRQRKKTKYRKVKKSYKSRKMVRKSFVK
jgi:lipopolysaccharide/colanic/teichoic acid biosynthesis glycosyltransferase